MQTGSKESGVAVTQAYNKVLIRCSKKAKILWRIAIYSIEQWINSIQISSSVFDSNNSFAFRLRNLFRLRRVRISPTKRGRATVFPTNS